MPSTFSVTSAADSGTNTLRAAIMNANTNPGPDTITFGITGAISLTTGEMAITDDLTITGPGASSLTINGGSGRAFNINTSGSVAIGGITVSNCTTTNSGAGVSVSGGSLSLSNSVITGNSAGVNGGGIYLNATAGDLTIDRCTISNNSAGTNGGGIDSRDGNRQIVILNSTIAGNTALARVGVSIVNGTQSLLIEDSAVLSNRGQGHAGGVGFYSTVGPNGVFIRNSTINGNSVHQGGGGIVFNVSGGTLTVQNCTITANTADGNFNGSGGGIENYGSGVLDLQSTIVAANVDNSGVAPDVASQLSLSVNYCAVGSPLGFTSTGSHNLGFGLDLKLAPLANNGGLTQTQKLLPGSPCFDAGSNPANLTTDQRGNGYARVGNNAADIGAFETLPVTTTWIGGATGAVNIWEEPTNWSNGVPGLADTAIFQSSGAKSFAPVQSVATAIASLKIDNTWGGTITSSAAFVVTGPSTWNSGSISVSAAGMTMSGPLTINNGAAIVLTGGGKLTTTGSITDTGTANLQITGTGTTFDNSAGGLFDIQGTGTITSSGTGIFTSEGTLRRSVGASGINLQTNFNLSGTIDVQTGSLTFASTSSTATVHDVALMSAPATYIFLSSGATMSISGLITCSGGGGIIQTGGTLQLAGDTTFNFPNMMHSWIGGTINLNGKTLINAPGSIIDLNNGAPVTVSGGGTLLNQGTILHANPGVLQINGAGTVLDTPVGGVYNLLSDGQITTVGTSGLFSVEGTLLRGSGSGAGLTAGTLACNFSLSGTIDVQSTKLILGGNNGSVSGATIKVAPTATLDLTGGVTTSFAGAITGSGGGKVLHSTGTVRLSGDATLNFPAPMYQWSGGALDLNGKSLTNNGAITLTNTSVVGLAGGKLTNNGTITQAGSAGLNINGATTILDNAATGLYDLQSGTQLSYSGTAGLFTNEGTLRRSTGGNAASLVCTFTVGGNIDVQVGTLTFAPSGSTGGVATATINVAPAATLNLTGGTTVTYSGSLTGSGGGTVALSSGTLSVPTTASFNFADGMLQWTGGSLSVVGTLTNAAGGFMTIKSTSGNTLSGGGTVSNAGTIRHQGLGSLSFSGATTTLDTVAGGLYDLQSDVQVASTGSAGMFSVEGTFRRSVSTGTGILASNFNLAGTVDVQLGALMLQPGSSATGTVNSANLNVASGAVLDLTGGATVKFSGAISSSGTGKLSLNSGTLSVPTMASFNFADPMFQVTGGTISVAGTLTNSSGSYLTNSAAGGFGVNGGGKFTNLGVIRQTGAGGIVIYGTGTTLDNAVGGLYDIQSNSQISFISTAGSFTNEGTLRRSVSTGTAALACNFSLGGTIDIQTGILNLAPSGTIGTINGANIQVATNAKFVPAAFANVNLAGAITGSGTGVIAMNGGTLMVPADASINFPDNLCQWSGSTLSIPTGVTLTNAGFIISNATGGGGGSLVGGGTLKNTGTIRLTSNSNVLISNAGTTLLNAPAGLFDITGTGAPIFSAVAGTFMNQGLFRKRIDPGQSTVTAKFANSGGTIDVQTGLLSFPSAVALNGGTLRGAGTVIAPINNGDGFVRPGNTTGKLIEYGDYTQGSTGTLFIELNGTAPADYDTLAVLGKVNLAGTLAPTIGYTSKVNDTFVIIDNDGNASTDTVTGTFNGLPEGALLPIGNGTAMISYKGGDGNDVTLKIVTPPTQLAAPEVSDFKINDGSVQRSRVTSFTVRFDQPVTLPADPTQAFQLIRQSDSAVVGLAAAVDNSGLGTVVTLTFIGGPLNFSSLADGRYNFTIFASQVSNAGNQLDGDANGVGGDDYVIIGNPPTNKLFRLFGDADGNGLVDGVDFGAFRSAFNTNSFNFDFDGSGLVDGTDFGQFRSRFGMAI